MMPQSPNPLWEILSELKSQKNISEILLNGPKSLFVEQKGKMMGLKFSINKRQALDFIDEVAAYNNKVCDDENPILNGLLPDGSRINILLEPFAHRFPAICIRKHSEFNTFSLNEGELFNIDQRTRELLLAMVRAKVNIIISGGTSCGKTTLLNTFLASVTEDERLIVIEETLELQIRQKNCVRVEATLGHLDEKIGLRELVQNSLRMRPDRIIIGETRGPEFLDLLMAMNTGHDGSMTTIHANSGKECIARMENLCLLAGLDLTRIALTGIMSSSLNIIIQLKKSSDGSRLVSEIIEVTGSEGETLSLSIIAKLDDEQKLQLTGIIPKCRDRLIQEGQLAANFFNT